MPADLHVWTALEGIRDELVAHLPAKITEIATAQSIKLPSPAGTANYVVTQDDQVDEWPDRGKGGMVFVAMEGDTDEEPYEGPWKDVKIPVLVVYSLQAADYNPEKADRASLLLSRAIDEVLEKEVEGQVTGVWLVEIESSTSETLEEGGRTERRAEVRATAYLRTTRAGGP